MQTTFHPTFASHSVESADRNVRGMYVTDDHGNLYQVLSAAELPHADMLFHRTVAFAVSGMRDWYVDPTC